MAALDETARPEADSVLSPQSSALRWLAHPWLTIRVQLALGVFFVAAALPKIADPPSFAHMIYNYRIMPGGAINFMALVMPWIELLCGLALILGIWTAAARSIVAAMLFVFIAAISVNLARGNAIDCGCFDPNPRPKSRAERLDDMRFVIYRDLAMLMMVGQLVYAGGRGRIAGGRGTNDVSPAPSPLPPAT